ncbi:MAG: kinase/pyrophosphorylase [Bacteroidales bacterium]|nr:kinase/pyrophosphorylase [Bacteroidales bacterium]
MDKSLKDNELTEKFHPIFVVSGGKGLAGHTMVHSLLIQYPDNKIPVIVVPEVQTKEKIEDVVHKVKKYKGLLVHTMVNTELRNILTTACEQNQVRHIDLMGPLANYLEQELGMKSVNVAGLYRRINAQYFKRVEAIEYSLNHDDGLDTERLYDAEIILAGVSRTGKTPLSVYMSMFGWKVANVPIVYGIEPPEALFKVDPKRVFGLSININQLISQRYKRVMQLKNAINESYIDKEHVRKEIQYANLLFEKGKFTVINVTNKPIETSANEIIGMISSRFGNENTKLEDIDS